MISALTIIRLILIIVIFLFSCSLQVSIPKDTLLVGNGAEVQDLDPAIVSGVTEHRVLSALFEGLTDLDPKTLEPIPAVAQSWQVSDDQTEYIFYLRRNARWSNGDFVTAHDFVNSWKRILTPSLSAEYAYLLFCIKNAKPFFEGRIEDFEQVGVCALSDYVLRVTLEAPTSYFLKMQIHNIWYPIHSEVIKKYGDINERNNPWTHAGSHVSNGPYYLKEWVPNKIITVERNPFYWNKEKVKITTISFYPIDNQQTEERLFRMGYLDLTSTIPLRKIEFYRQQRARNLLIYPYVGVYYYRVNVTEKPLDNVKLRKALAHAIDTQQITEFVLRGGEKPAHSYVPPELGSYIPPHLIQFNPELAKQLLKEAGYEEGKGLTTIEILFNTSESHKLIAEAVQRMWKQYLGIEVRLLNQDWKVYITSMNQLDYQVARSGWIADFLDPINFLECFLSYSGNNRTGWSNPRFDQLIEMAYREKEVTKRNQLMFDAETILLEEAPILPIYFYTWKMLISDRVRGLQPNILGYIRWQDLSLEEVE